MQYARGWGETEVGSDRQGETTLFNRLAHGLHSGWHGYLHGREVLSEELGGPARPLPDDAMQSSSVHCPRDGLPGR